MEVISKDLVREILSEIRARYNYYDLNELAGYDAITKALRRINDAPSYWLKEDR